MQRRGQRDRVPGLERLAHELLLAQVAAFAVDETEAERHGGDLACRVAGGIAAPGSHGSGRDSLPSPGSCRLDLQKVAIHAQWANSRGCWTVMRCQHARA